MAIRINSLKPGTLTQIKPLALLRLVHLAWASLKQWLLHVILLWRDPLAWASHTFTQNNTHTSPERGFNEKCINSTSWPRLGGPLSPRRECPWLRTQTSRLDEKSRSKWYKFSSRPRLGEPFSPKRERLSLKPHPGRLSEQREPKPERRLCNSRLDEMESPGRDLQSFLSVHAHNSPKTIPKHQPIITSTM